MNYEFYQRLPQELMKIISRYGLVYVPEFYKFKTWELIKRSRLGSFHDLDFYRLKNPLKDKIRTRIKFSVYNEYERGDAMIIGKF